MGLIGEPQILMGDTFSEWLVESTLSSMKNRLAKLNHDEVAQAYSSAC